MSSLPLVGRVRSQDPLLVIVPSVTVGRDGNHYVIDEKAVSGLGLYLKHWPGPVRCIFRSGDRSALTFGKSYNPAELPFEIHVLPTNGDVADELISDASVVLASGDNWLDFPMAEQGLRLGVPVCFVIEYVLPTRLQIVSLSEAPLVPKLKSWLWTLFMERKRRRAFSRSSGLQSNGTPAAATYGRLAPNLLTFFDTRLSERQMATDREIAVKQARLMSGAPLRLAFTGRLEKLKGADDLIKIASVLDRAGRNFTLNVYGSGSLKAEMTAALNDPVAGSLRQKVCINPPIDFNHELVPWIRSEVDLFICCHRQSDPSCTYLETLGCGVPILGYRNRALAGILNLADIGWMTRPNSREEMVRKIADLDSNRFHLASKMRNARNFAKDHSFESEFKSRVDHLWQTANYTDSRSINRLV
jgi:colanic acid/amylovoran biosynthesis glycosyltransferase